MSLIMPTTLFRRKIVFVMVGILLFFLNTAHATSSINAAIPAVKDTWTLSQITPDYYSQLNTDTKKNIAAMWNLSVTDYTHYLWLMNNSVSGVYYKNKNLDPSWILGFNAKNEQERKKYVLIAIKNERLRVAKELAFQQDFTRLQKELYPNLPAILWR
jgi:hypothetical protein